MILASRKDTQRWHRCPATTMKACYTDIRRRNVSDSSGNIHKREIRCGNLLYSPTRNIWKIRRKTANFTNKVARAVIAICQQPVFLHLIAIESYRAPDAIHSQAGSTKALNLYRKEMLLLLATIAAYSVGHA